jgi:diacylglycerol kinase (ATP)
MKMNKPFSLRARRKSFSYAFNGIKLFFQQEHNALLHAFATILVICLAFIFSVSKVEIILLTFSVGFVWAAELFNTAIEKAMDFISTEKQAPIKYIKDLSAAAVLIAASTAFVTGLLVFIPKLLLCLA